MIFWNNQLEFTRFSRSNAEKLVKEHPQSLLAQNRAKDRDTLIEQSLTLIE